MVSRGLVAGRSLTAGEGESESGGELFGRNGPACLVGPDGVPVAEGGWEIRAGDSDRREVGGEAAAGDAETHRSAWVSTGPVDGLAEGVDLVVVFAVGEGGGFLDQVCDPVGCVVAGGGVGGGVAGEVDVAALERWLRRRSRG